MPEYPITDWWGNYKELCSNLGTYKCFWTQTKGKVVQVNVVDWKVFTSVFICTILNMKRGWDFKIKESGFLFSDRLYLEIHGV